MASISTNVLWKRTPVLQRVLFLSFYSQPTAALSQDAAITATVDAAKTGAPISPPAIVNAAAIPKIWRVPGAGGNVITMDSKAPCTGNKSPAVHLSAADPHGLLQLGPVVRAEKTYAGRIILSDTPGKVAKVALIWVSRATDRQAITSHTLSRGYRNCPLRYIANPENSATGKITETGTGQLHVGAVSLMPASPSERNNTL